jgi:oligopeptide/dipeptide ABC transporter ATP-binding protein
MSLLRVENLSVTFKTSQGEIKAVQDVSFKLEKGKTMGLVGESGSGKSTIANAIIGIVENPHGKISFRGQNTIGLSGKDKKKLKREVSMVFQDPMASLDPRRTIAQSIMEPVEVHGLYRGNRKKRLKELMEMVGLSESFASRYPRQLSGGQRQRACIARALASDPDLVILDEATASLDVSVQASILNLLKEIQQQRGLSYLFISHDLNVVNYMSDEVMVLYLGKTMETMPAKDLFTGNKMHFGKSAHPYTHALLSAVPDEDPNDPPTSRIMLEGDLPSPANPPSGCVFRTRCPLASEICAEEVPRPIRLSEDHLVSCHHFEKAAEQEYFNTGTYPE